jgi:hypothetical protein|tara:strand:+ start:1067 stop:1753 length:687 start_codon:yes stop_codon:yes gene_type:complete
MSENQAEYHRKEAPKEKNKITSRWYYVLILTPLLTDLVTNTFKTDKLDIKTKIIIGLVVIIIVLVFELLKALKKAKSTVQPIPIPIPITSRDKRIINELLKMLDIQDFEEYILNKNAWYGYNRTAMDGIFDFTHEAQKITNQLTDQLLVQKVNIFTQKLIIFTSFTGEHLGNDDIMNKYTLPKNDIGVHHELRQELMEVSDKMNTLAQETKPEFIALMNYLANKQYID